MDETVNAARARLRRLPPVEAYVAMDIDDAALVDGCVRVDCFDPASEVRMPAAAAYELPIVVIRAEGYTSTVWLRRRFRTGACGGPQRWSAASTPGAPRSCQ